MTKEAGQHWADKLLLLPAFLSPEANTRACDEELLLARDLIGYFFKRNVYAPRNVQEPLERISFYDAAAKALRLQKDAA